MFAESNVLLIKHLPASLNANDKQDLLKHFGAKSVRCMPSYGRMRHSAFAEFSTKEEANLALNRLHQLKILGCCLNVQFGKSEEAGHFPHESESKKSVEDFQDDPKKQKQGKKEVIHGKIEEFKKRLNSVTSEFGLNYPFPSTLKYKYPPPTPSIITNIAHALATIPKFYTQVLHLMNKMNIPAPFGLVTMAPPLAMDPPMLIGIETNYDPDSYVQQEMDIMSEEESEVESESESESSTVKNTERKQIKRPMKRTSRKMKKPRLQQLMSSVAQPAQDGFKVRMAEPSEVFETVEMEAKKIQFNIKPTSEQAIEEQIENENPSEMQIQEGGFGIIEPQKAAEEIEQESEDTNEEMWKGVKFVSSSELDRNRISSKDMKSQAVFKNYDSGEPTYRLYVKNLAKQVSEKDLLSIYGKYINRKLESERNMFDVRLMKEGRMKGQAFVTLANEEQALRALKDTHGYLLHGKPIVVQFARSAKPKGNDEKKKGKKA